jgi:hypothetical protein
MLCCEKIAKNEDLCTLTMKKMQNGLLKINIIMDPDLKKLSLGSDKKIENLLNIIRSVRQSTHYFQQACISNLLVTVFAARRLDNLLITNIFQPLTNCVYGRPTRKELTARPHA